MSAPDPEEIASFRWGGVRARPRKKIEGKTLTGATYLKPPGSLGSRWPGLGISIEIECCDDCQIYILDKTEQVQVADCKNCRVVVGPCVGSVFFMDCVGCTFSVAAKQIRVRDVTSSELRIYAPTHECAVVETSSALSFRAWDVAYAGLAAQFSTTGWDGAVNHWDRVYDFSPAEPGAPPTFTLLPVEAQRSTRWSELSVSPEGLSGGSVVERCGPEAATPECECPVLAADGTQYDGVPDAQPGTRLRPAPTTAPPPAPASVAPPPAAPAPDAPVSSDGSYRLGAHPVAAPASTAAPARDCPGFLVGWAEAVERTVSWVFRSALRMCGLAAQPGTGASSPRDASKACAVM